MSAAAFPIPITLAVAVELAEQSGATRAEITTALVRLAALLMSQERPDTASPAVARSLADAIGNEFHESLLACHQARQDGWRPAGAPARRAPAKS